MEHAPVLVIGATGSVGRRVAARLRELHIPRKEAARHGPTRFDWGDPGTWEPALEGVRRVFLMAPDGVGVDPTFVRLLADSEVERVVLLSSRAIEAMRDDRLLNAERTVQECGTGWTIVRADWFNQNFDEGPFRDSVLAGELAVPLGDTRQTFVDVDDIAAVTVQTLTEGGHLGRTYEVTGPEALAFGQVCALISSATGRPLSFDGDPTRYRAAQIGAGRPHQEVEAELAAFAGLRSLGDSKPLDTVPRLTGRPAKPFQQYVAETAALGRWQPGVESVG